MTREQEQTMDWEDEKIDDPAHFLLHHGMRGIFEAEEMVEGDCIVIPEWELTIRPHVAKWTDQTVMLQFQVSSPKWDRDIYETTAGIGSSLKNAFGTAIGGFAFSFMEGIASMEQDRNPETLHSTYGDTVHHWKAYKSNIVGLGESSPEMEESPYWETLKDEIAKRIGDQKLCYIKIYAAKHEDDITGECRINDIPSPELGQIVAEIASKWQVEGFASQKQFIFLLQSEETYTPYPYSPEHVAEATHTAVRLFMECDTQEKYDNFTDILAERLQDSDLAQELYSFLPEICAEHAFDMLCYNEELLLYRGEESFNVYRTQFASYSMISNALFEGFRTGEFDDDVYKQYISVSSIYNVICQAREQGADLVKDGGVLTLSYGMSEQYRFR
ncbi:DUF6348 family protein [Paenibacillus alvei]|uniref:DUF6348 family protein n=1 Tax=Paenibacillus alvei TaxID=44250 RepID=UPI000287B312|nr:DUF6348 family protein [Paenibacillus alvei]EJW15969.1 hypothetical protein PAV_6c00470 [Paenibacillus alvei DSM 29]MCY9540082.1 DUF6348 family protein [Paenibacillus alvei]MCY9704672.1 DUF6348 family protein [Paenibacillus alvei]MCY9732668.1 DUF6348 family protein [Paenibacillus alvei]MCY9755011.1 DUF6348 family protein [Paenibacillus alvei]